MHVPCFPSPPAVVSPPLSAVAPRCRRDRHLDVRFLVGGHIQLRSGVVESAEGVQQIGRGCVEQHQRARVETRKMEANSEQTPWCAANEVPTSLSWFMSAGSPSSCSLIISESCSACL